MSAKRWQKVFGTTGLTVLMTLGSSGLGIVPASAATTGGTIVDGIFEEPANLNPILGPDMTFSNMVETTMFRNLFMMLPNGSMAPDLATVVPSVANGGISKNGLVYTFHIKPNARWSNGQAVTSKDVWITWKLITNPAVTAVSRLGWSDVKQFKTINAKTFQLVLDKPYAPLLAAAFSGNLPGILPYSVFAHVNGAAVNKLPWNHAPTVADGPFKFKQWIPGTSITVVPNPYWYGPKAKASEIVFNVIPNENTLLANAQAHELNVWYFDPIEDVSQLQAIPGATVHFTTQPAWESVVLNLHNPILQDVRVRQALELAINRQALVTSIWKGHATLLAADQPSASWAYNPALKPYPYNPTRAGQLLQAAGWKMGPGGYRVKNGKTLTLVYATTSGNPWRGATERLVQFWLKQVGIKLVIHNYLANEYFGSVLPSGKGWDLGEYEYIDSPDPALGPQTLYTTGGASNWGGFSNKTLNSLFIKQGNLVTQAARQKVLRQAETILHQQLPALWYYSPQEIDTSINMTGYQPNPWGIDTWNSWAWALKK